MASIYLHHPSMEGLVDIIDSVKFTFEGKHNQFGNTLEISQSGFLGLEGHNE